MRAAASASEQVSEGESLGMEELHNTEGGQPQRPVIYDFDPRNIPPEYLRAVGLVAMASAQTESIIGAFIGAILGADEIETLTLTAHMAAPLRDQVARALIELNATSADVVDDTDDLLDSINEALGRRNIVVHNRLIRHPDTGDIFSHRLKARGSLQLELKPITVAEIEEDAALIYEAGIALQRFMLLRGILPENRLGPLWEPLDRRKKARQERRNSPVRYGGGS